MVTKNPILKIQWETVYELPNQGTGHHEATYRAKVEGGWLYRHHVQFNSGGNPAPGARTLSITETMAFVPDAEAK